MRGSEGRLSDRWWMAPVVALALVGCAQTEDLPLPGADEARDYYAYQGDLEAELNGNVVEITVVQPAAQLRRGGSLWAKVGPYVVLFSDGTRQLFRDWPGVAGVRVVTRIRNGPEVARALLPRSELSDVLWRRSLNIAGKARRDGTTQVTLLSDLVDWGEDHTEHEYNSRYAGR